MCADPHICVNLIYIFQTYVYIMLVGKRKLKNHIANMTFFIRE